MTGLEFESAVIGEIYKQVMTNDIPVHMYHLTRSDARHMVDVGEILDKPVILSVIISLDTVVKEFGNNIYEIPAGLFLI